jgi:hypothetical protein
VGFILAQNTKIMVIVLVGTIHDVVLGGDEACATYEGNKRFRSVLHRFKHQFRAAFTWKRRKVILRRVLDRWKSLDPPGRFLKSDDEMFVVASDEESLMHIAQMQRDNFPHRDQRLLTQAQPKKLLMETLDRG